MNAKIAAKNKLDPADTSNNSVAMASPLIVSIIIKPWLKLGTHMFDVEGWGDKKPRMINGRLGTNITIPR